MCKSFVAFLFFCSLAIFLPVAFASTDYKCVSDCTQQGYLNSFCQSKCSYDTTTEQPTRSINFLNANTANPDFSHMADSLKNYYEPAMLENESRKAVAEAIQKEIENKYLQQEKEAEIRYIQLQTQILQEQIRIMNKSTESR